MLLIDVGKLVEVEATSANSLRIVRSDFPRGYQVVEAPIKVKLGTDMLIVIDVKQDATGQPVLAADILKSTSRKFQSNYVLQVLQDKVSYYDYRKMQFKSAEHVRS